MSIFVLLLLVLDLLATLKRCFGVQKRGRDSFKTTPDLELTSRRFGPHMHSTRFATR